MNQTLLNGKFNGFNFLNQKDTNAIIYKSAIYLCVNAVVITLLGESS